MGGITELPEYFHFRNNTHPQEIDDPEKSVRGYERDFVIFVIIGCFATIASCGIAVVLFSRLKKKDFSERTVDSPVKTNYIQSESTATSSNKSQRSRHDPPPYAEDCPSTAAKTAREVTNSDTEPIASSAYEDVTRYVLTGITSERSIQDLKTRDLSPLLHMSPSVHLPCRRPSNTNNVLISAASTTRTKNREASSDIRCSGEGKDAKFQNSIAQKQGEARKPETELTSIKSPGAENRRRPIRRERTYGESLLAGGSKRSE